MQVANSLDWGDGVSKDIFNKHKLFQDMGYTSEIYTKWSAEECNKNRNPIETLRAEKKDILLYHFCGKNYVSKEISNCDCTKVLVYHNITPPSFFEHTSPYYSLCIDGLKDLRREYRYYDYFLGDSQYNINCMIQEDVIGDMDILPILIDFDKLESFKLGRKIKKYTQHKVFLFVGRIAPNKKQEDVIDIFDHYYKYVNADSELVFVGNLADIGYFEKLKKKIAEMQCRDYIIFTGKISDNEVYAQYERADIFICMSEHEGFCIPLLESMYCGIPTMAFDSCAISSTMGDAGILVKVKNKEMLARLSHVVLGSKSIEKIIQEKQFERVKSFSRDHIMEKLKQLLKKWES
jgi:glycosyltransferase involved in cell wall biosynthesis